MGACTNIAELLTRSLAENHRCIIIAYGAHAPNVARVILECCSVKGETICVLARSHESRSCVFAKLKACVVTCTYKKSITLLGRTFSAMAVCDFAQMTPSVLLRAFETVAGGGPIVLLFEGANSRRDVRDTNIDACKKYKAGCVKSRYFRRILRQLLRSEFVATIKSSMHTAQRLQSSLKRASVRTLCIKARDKCCDINAVMTAEQLSAYEHIAAKMKSKTFRVILYGPRGRGKSTVLGALAAHAAIEGVPRVVVTAPSLSCAEAVLVHCEQALAAATVLKRSIHSGDERKKIIVGGCVIEYVAPEFVDTQDVDLLIVDEAAALGHRALDRMLKAKRVLLASTIGGYEGTGRSIAMKVLKREEIYAISMEQPVRYAANDPVEQWLREMVLFDVGCASLGEDTSPENCVLLAVNKRRLLRDERTLAALCSLFTQCHYRSSPDDLMAVVDCPRMCLIVLCTGSEDAEAAVFCAMQIAIEGPVEMGTKKDGNQMPWALYEFHNAECFLRRPCARIVRIAVHPSQRRQGIGSLCLDMLCRTFFNEGRGQRWRVPSSSGVFAPLSSCEVPAVDYIGAGFGLEHRMLMFWLKNGYQPLYVRGERSMQTGEHTIIVAKALASSVSYIAEYETEFRRRFSASLRHTHAQTDPRLCLQILDPGCNADDPAWSLCEYDARRMRKFVLRFSSVYCVADLLPAIAERLLFSRRLSATALEKCVLLMLGLQCRSVDDVLRVLGLEHEHLRYVVCAMFERILAGHFPAVQRAFIDTV